MKLLSRLFIIQCFSLSSCVQCLENTLLIIIKSDKNVIEYDLIATGCVHSYLIPTHFKPLVIKAYIQRALPALNSRTQGNERLHMFSQIYEQNRINDESIMYRCNMNKRYYGPISTSANKYSPQNIVNTIK